MHLIKRLAVTISGRLEQTVDAIANHQALVESAIDQAQQSLTSLQVEDKQLASDIQQQQNQLQQLEQTIDRWQQRAIAHLNDQDSAKPQQEQQALRCLEERDRHKQQRDRRQQQLQQQKQQQAQLRALIERTECEIDQAIRQRDALRRRDLGAQTQTDIHHCLNEAGLKDSLKHWESQVLHKEVRHQIDQRTQSLPGCPKTDATTESTSELEQRYAKQEQQQQRRNELKQLRADSQPTPKKPSSNA